MDTLPRASNSLVLSGQCRVTFHRTLRIPDDGRDHPLPPSLGTLPVFEIEPGEVVIPLRRMEALWLSFAGPYHRPHALKVGIGGVDALSGEPFDPGSLTPGPQDYLVIPDQPWLDGINAGDGFIRQFVAVPLGEGLTVEAQLSGREAEGGMELSLFAPVPGRFPDTPPRVHPDDGIVAMACCAAPMGLGAGGRMRQEIYADEYGPGTWQAAPENVIRVDIIDALAFEALTGIELPDPPIDAETYTRHGLPWFDLLDPTRADIAAAERLAGVRSIADLEGRTEDSLPIPEEQVRRLLRLRSSAAA